MADDSACLFPQEREAYEGLKREAIAKYEQKEEKYVPAFAVKVRKRSNILLPRVLYWEVSLLLSLHRGQAQAQNANRSRFHFVIKLSILCSSFRRRVSDLFAFAGYAGRKGTLFHFCVRILSSLFVFSLKMKKSKRQKHFEKPANSKTHQRGRILQFVHSIL